MNGLKKSAQKQKEPFDVVERLWKVKGWLYTMDQLKWTSVKERMPEKDGCYLVTALQCGWKPIVCICELAGKYWYSTDDNVTIFLNEHVLAWMPIPKPYQGD